MRQQRRATRGEYGHIILMRRMGKKQLVIRISDTLWEELNRMANDEFRSLNAQIEYILTCAVRNKRTKVRVIAEELVEALSAEGVDAKRV